jgi:cell wall-associated NlpC family hydrolase
MRPHASRRHVALAALAATSAFALLPGPAAADPTTVEGTRARYATVRAQVRALDERAERQSERYNRAVWQVGVLRGRVRDATARLEDARRRLAEGQSLLSSLVVTRYKGGSSHDLEILLGSASLSQVTSGIDLEQRFDAAVAEAVAAIRAARDQIVAERRTLVAERRQAQRQERTIAQSRRAIRVELARRRALMSTVEARLRLAEAAERVGQGDVALAARQWIQEDMRTHADDPGALLRDRIVLDGLKQIGVPYLWGGATPKGFDCSGLVMWLWAKHGYTFPHFAKAQYQMGPQVDESDLRPGDLVFFHELGHVGIYIGNGYVLHAPHTGTTVQIAPFSSSWFQSTFVGATRPGPA